MERDWLMKNCSKCNGKLKTVGFFRTKGWQCEGCKGTFVRFRYLSHSDQLKRRLDSAVRQSKPSRLKCLECGETMRLLKLGDIGLELDFCPNDYNIWFDISEPERFMKWGEKHAPPDEWKNPDEPSDAAVMAALYFA